MVFHCHWFALIGDIIEGTMKTSAPRSHSRHHGFRAGFTLVEMLIVIGITTLLSVVAIGYSKAGQNEVALTVETSKVAELILQARALAINTYGGVSNGGTRVCAFGVHFEIADPTDVTYSLFAYGVDPKLQSRCPSIASTTAVGLNGLNGSNGIGLIQQYEPSGWNVPVAQGVTIDSQAGLPADALTDVLFYPPDPATLISRGDPSGYVGKFMDAPQTSYIYLSTIDGLNKTVISVSPDGQVNF